MSHLSLQMMSLKIKRACWLFRSWGTPGTSLHSQIVLLEPPCQPQNPKISTSKRWRLRAVTSNNPRSHTETLLFQPPSLFGSTKEQVFPPFLPDFQLPLALFPSQQQLFMGSWGGHKISGFLQKCIKSPRKKKKPKNPAANLPVCYFLD